MAHNHTHDHAHGDHAGHTHGVSANADRRYLAIALALIVGFMLAEVIVGILASSLALISDAGHMLTDAGALALALVAMRLAARPAAGAHTFGLKRVEILSAQANGITLLALAALFIYEGIRRLIWPPQVEGGLVFIVALVGIAVNLLATWALSKANRQSLNVEGSFQHILTDLYAFIATAIAGGLIQLTGINRFDAIAALVVAALMLRAGYGLVKASWRIFLEAAPRGIDPEEVGATLAAEHGVARVHDLHVWEVTSGFPALSAHVQVAGDRPLSACDALLGTLNGVLAQRYNITHTTIQFECADCAPRAADTLYCALDAAGAGAGSDEHDDRGHDGYVHDHGAPVHAPTGDGIDARA